MSEVFMASMITGFCYKLGNFKSKRTFELSFQSSCLGSPLFFGFEGYVSL